MINLSIHYVHHTQVHGLSQSSCCENQEDTLFLHICYANFASIKFEYIVCCGFLMTIYGYTWFLHVFVNSLKMFLNKPKHRCFKKMVSIFRTASAEIKTQKAKFEASCSDGICTLKFVFKN